MFELKELSVCQIYHKVLARQKVELFLLRLDLTDGVVSGNKWFKLKYNLQYAITAGYNSVLSFGGAYSNHIHALAKAGYDLGLETIGVIRGEPEYATNPTLADAVNWGMKLHFITRREYRQKADKAFLAALRHRFNNPFIIPEGGSNQFAVKGASEILSPKLLDDIAPDQIVLACGTGGTMAGVIIGSQGINVLGIPVLKKADFLYDDIADLVAQVAGDVPGHWMLDLEGHYGGYAKRSQEVDDFILDFQKSNNIQLDHIYTGKMLLRLIQRVAMGIYPAGSRILALHTGGLQGLRGISSEVGA